MQVAETARIRWNRNRQLVLRRDDFLQVCPALEAEVDELIHIRLGLEDYGLVVPGSDVAHRLCQRNLIHIEIAFQPVGG